MFTPQCPQPLTLSQIQGGYLDLPDAHNNGPGIMEKQMETTMVYWGLYRDNGKENGNYYSLYLRSKASIVSIWEVEVHLMRRQRGPREELPPRADNKVVEALGLWFSVGYDFYGLHFRGGGGVLYRNYYLSCSQSYGPLFGYRSYYGTL